MWKPKQRSIFRPTHHYVILQRHGVAGHSDTQKIGTAPNTKRLMVRPAWEFEAWICRTQSTAPHINRIKFKYHNHQFAVTSHVRIDLMRIISCNYNSCKLDFFPLRQVTPCGATRVVNHVPLSVWILMQQGSSVHHPKFLAWPDAKRFQCSPSNMLRPWPREALRAGSLTTSTWNQLEISSCKLTADSKLTAD